MAIPTNTGNGNDNFSFSDAMSNGQSNDAGNASGLESDPVFAKHLDIAIEAQDGKKEPAPNTAPEGGEPKSKEGDQQATGDAKDSKSGDGNRPAQQQPEQKGKKEEGQAPGPKDLKLPDGTVIKGGSERRFYEQRELARQQLQARTNELDQVRGEVTRLNSELDAMRQAVQSVNGLPPQEVALGVRILSDLKRDPVGALKKLLAEAVSQGHTIEGIGSGVDQLALQRMLDERLGSQQQPQQISEQEAIAEAQREATAFFTAHPDARTHEPLLARVLNDHPHLSLEDAYYQSKNWFIENGYDWSQPLQAQQAASNNNTQQQPQNKAPLPNGGNVASNNAPVVKASEVPVAHEDTSMDEIIKAAMRENGLNV
jgi:hypothetical protein